MPQPKFLTRADYRHNSVRGTVSVDVLLILHVSRTTKITVTLFTIILTYSPLAPKQSGGTTECVMSDSPYNGGARVTKSRDCMSTESFVKGREQLFTVSNW